MSVSRPCAHDGQKHQSCHDSMLKLTLRFGLFRYDEEHSADDKVFLDCFCKIAAGIKNNSNGHQLKDLILQKGITQNALDYMKKHIPDAKK